MIPFSTAKIDIISYSPKFFNRNFAKTKELGKQKRSALGTPQLFQH